MKAHDVFNGHDIRRFLSRGKGCFRLLIFAPDYSQQATYG
jgi:hypothetical protein